MNNTTQLTDERVNELAKDFIAWGKGSWGQSHNDITHHHFGKEDIVRLYERISQLTKNEANYYKQQNKKDLL